MKINIKNNKVVVFAGLLIMAFVVFNFVGAEGDEKNYFQDRDQDGLSDEEEKALGTDWQNKDTDGDGYTDGVEVSSGYDPLIPAPGDKLSGEDVADRRNNNVLKNGVAKKKNLTQEFIAKLKSRKDSDIEIFKDASAKTGLVTDIAEIKKLKDASLTVDDINELTEETLREVDIESELQLMKEEEFKILPKVEAKSDRKKREAIKKELEDYLAVTGFVMVNSLPFKVNENDTFNDKLDDFMVGISDDIVMGSTIETRGSKNNLRSAFEELQKLDVPYVLKDIHIRSLSLLKYLLAQDESVMFAKDDPIAMGLMIGKIQSVMNEMQETQSDLEGILLKYGVGEDDDKGEINEDIDSDDKEE